MCFRFLLSARCLAWILPCPPPPRSKCQCVHHHGYHRERGRLHPGSVVKPYLCCCVGGPSHFSHYCSPWTPGLLHAVQQANGGLLNTSVPQDVQQVPIFSPGMADHGLFNLASMFQALPALYVLRENKLYIQILFSSFKQG